jgi:predicted dehydrogenase
VSSLHRRSFLKKTAAASLAFAAPAIHVRGSVGPKSPNEKLNIGVVGTAHRAAANIQGTQGENIVALCDIDERYLGEAQGRFPSAKTYHDFRKMLEQPGIDAVVVSTADHVHAPASVMAMKMGKHCYCEKPLAHNVYEARVVAETAKKMKVATQMGTQIHAEDNYRRVVELIQSGAIGPVRDVHVWCGKTWSGGDRPKETPEVPSYLHWDLWLGPAPERPYHPTYLPANWRRWWDFGSGTLGDMACHYMDLPFWALDLRHPTLVASEGPPVHPETTPAWLIVRYEFPQRGKMPARKLTWYDHDKRPELLAKQELPKWDSGVLFVGDEGMLLADYGRRKLYPEDKFKDFKAPEPTIPKSIGHHAEWIKACKEGTPTTCSFDYSGALTESVLLGNAAFRAGQKLDWDGANLKATNCPSAEQYLRREYRKGWTL